MSYTAKFVLAIIGSIIIVLVWIVVALNFLPASS